MIKIEKHTGFKNVLQVLFDNPMEPMASESVVNRIRYNDKEDCIEYESSNKKFWFDFDNYDWLYDYEWFIDFYEFTENYSISYSACEIRSNARRSDCGTFIKNVPEHIMTLNGRHSCMINRKSVSARKVYRETFGKDFE